MNIIKNKKGLSIIECIIALFLTTVMVVSLINMQSLSWFGAGKSDYLGRAVGILQRELEIYEYDIMKEDPPDNETICADKDGNEVACDDASALFTITVATSTPATIPAGTTLLNVRIQWPQSANGLSSSIIVSSQSGF
ncbi:MAG: hypothetical protein WC373_00130 [Smithella sp.]|jgi:Tfp pilus assembly protein PilV